jgi:hypothetical protein
MHEWQYTALCPIPFKGDFKLQFRSKVGHVFSGNLSREWGPEFVEVSIEGLNIIAIAPLANFTDWRFQPNEKGETDDR